MSPSPQTDQPPWALKNLFSDPVVPVTGGRVKLTDVNPHLVCVLCHGYFVDATSIVECLHSFCRSCIVLHLDKNNFCPICREDIQNSKALKPDKALQDIVYKLVPGLFHSEMQRRQQFYKEHPQRDMHLHPESRGISVDRIVYKADELISLSLEYYDKECEQEMWKSISDDKGLHYVLRNEKSLKGVIRKRYLKCPAAVRMSHLKKFIRLKYNLKPYDIVELMYRRESLSEEYSIMDIAYIYTWNRNEPMRFFYKINARVTIPIIPAGGKHFPTLTDSTTTELSDLSNTTVETTLLPPRVTTISVSSPVVEITEEDEKKAAAEILKKSNKEESKSTEIDQGSKVDLALKEPLVVRSDLNKKDRRSSPPPIAVSTVPLNPPISPEGTSRKENISDNVRNNCANDSPKSTLPAGTATEEKKSIDSADHHQTDTITDVPMKKLEKLVDQQQETPPTTVATTVATTTTSPVLNTTTSTTNSSPSAPALPKKPVSGGESKLNLSISKLIMKNQNASAATKFVPTLQQMQQIGMHTSIPSFQQQQQLSTLQPNAYIRPGFPGMHSFKRNPDMAPARSQAPTNRPPFIPVRKSYEWNKARTLAAKPLPPPVTTTIKDNKANEKPSLTMTEKSTKKTSMDKTPTTASFSAKNSDEMNAAQSLLKVGQDLRHLKQPIISSLHDKYNCESSLQITKVTEPETNQIPVAHEIHSNSQPSLQIMRVPPATEKSTKPIKVDTSNGNSNGNGSAGVPSTNKPVNKKPVPSLYSMSTKRTKEDHHHNVNNDNKRIERRVDTENGVLSVSLLTETSKQDMDAKRREVVQPDVSIKLMTFATEAAKKTPELSPIATGGVNNKKRLDELNPVSSGAGNVNKRKLDEVNPVCGANKRKQDEPERKVTPPKPAPSKDDVPQLIEINSSPYAKLLPTKKQQPAPKQQPTAKQQPSPKQQVVPKQQPAPKVLDLSKSPPNGGIKRLVATDGSGGGSPPPNKKKTTSPVQSASSTMAAANSAATAAAINSNLLFAAQRQAAAFLLKQHFESFNNGLLRNGGKGPVEWPRAMFNPALFARPPTNLNN